MTIVSYGLGISPGAGVTTKYVSVNEVEILMEKEYEVQVSDNPIELVVDSDEHEIQIEDDIEVTTDGA